MMVATSSAAPRTTAGIAPKIATPEPQRSAGICMASQTHRPALARL